MSPPRASDVELGRYRLGRRLAMGGMGEVFLATQLGLGGFARPVVLKLLLPHLAEDPRCVAMFVDEARVAARMSHPNVVQILEVGHEGGRYFLALEQVRGISASALAHALLEVNQQLEADLLVYLGRALCAGLHHAHEQVDANGQRLELVHRDVSPQNLLVSVEGEVKLTDFGIALVRDRLSTTQPGTIRGKFEYLSPEQLQGASLDRRTDVYGAALTLFHLATLRSPFRRESPHATMDAALSSPLPSLAALRPDLPPRVVSAIERAAQRDRAARFPSAEAFRDALGPHSGDAAERLGALVLRLTGEPLRDAVVERRTRITEDLADEALTELESPRPKPASSRAVGVVLGVLALTAATVAVVTSTRGLQGSDAAAGSGNTVQPHDGAGKHPMLGGSGEPATGASTGDAPPTETAAAGASTTRASATEASPSGASPSGASPTTASPTTASPPLDPPSSTSASSASRPLTSPGASASTSRGPVRSATRSRTRASASSTAPREVGFISVDATPWARVSLGSRRLGDTPLANFPVEAGRVELTFHNPDSGRSVKRTVVVEAGRTAFLKVSLE